MLKGTKFPDKIFQMLKHIDKVESGLHILKPFLQDIEQDHKTKFYIRF